MSRIVGIALAMALVAPPALAQKVSPASKWASTPVQFCQSESLMTSSSPVTLRSVSDRASACRRGTAHGLVRITSRNAPQVITARDASSDRDWESPKGRD